MAIKKPKEENELPFEENGQEKIISFDKKQEEIPTMKVNFQDEDLASEFAAQSTKTSTDEEAINPNKPADEIRDEVREYEKSKSSKMEYKDLLKTAEFLINLIDTAISTGLNFLAKDSAVQAYSMPSSNKKLLTEQLALILSKYQSKFSVEFLFFSGLIVLYAPLAIGAVKNRKINKNMYVKKAEEKIKDKIIKEDSDYLKDTALSKKKIEVIEVKEVKEEKIEEEKIIDEKELNIPFRVKRGRPRGAQKKAN